MASGRKVRPAPPQACHADILRRVTLMFRTCWICYEDASAKHLDGTVHASRCEKEQCREVWVCSS